MINSDKVTRVSSYFVVLIKSNNIESSLKIKKKIQTLKTNILVTSDRIWIKLYSLDSPHQDESNGSIFIQFWLLVTEIFVFKVFVELYIKLLTNQNCGLIAELRIIKVLRTLRIFRLKIRKWLQYLNLQLICNSELQVPSLLLIMLK